MKFVMTLRARDEADVIDARIAFHLGAGVDFVVATGHRSEDGTTEILEYYARDGYLHLIREPEATSVATRLISPIVGHVGGSHHPPGGCSPKGSRLAPGRGSLILDRYPPEAAYRDDQPQGSGRLDRLWKGLRGVLETTHPDCATQVDAAAATSRPSTPRRSRATARATPRARESRVGAIRGSRASC